MHHHDPYVTRFADPVSAGVDGVCAGMTFAAKDLFHVAGQRTGLGNPHLETSGVPASEHAAIVKTLLDVGAALTGITRLDELALNLNGINGHIGPEFNPRYPGHITGGSSSGSAAVVANGDVTFALGSDTGGSLRLPASFCGLFTLRPTHNRIDVTGMAPLAPSLDTPGVFTRELSVLTDVSRLLLRGEPGTQQITRILTPTNMLRLCERKLADHTVDTATRLAATLGIPHVIQPLNIDLVALKRAFLTVLGAEAYATHVDLLTRHPDVLCDATRRVLEHGQAITPDRRADAETWRKNLTDMWVNELAQTVIVTPAAPCLPPKTDAAHDVLHDMNVRAVTLNAFASLTKTPCVVVPQQLVSGDTFGLCLTGPPYADEMLLAIAEKIR